MDYSLAYFYMNLVLYGVEFLTIVLFVVCYFLKMAPRKGTLEWISMVDKPRWSRPGLFGLRLNAVPVLAIVLLITAVLAFLRTNQLATFIWSCLGAAFIAFALLRFTGEALLSACCAILLGAADLGTQDTGLMVFSLGFFLFALSDKKLLLRILWFLFALLFFVLSRLIIKNGYLGIVLPRFGVLYSPCIPLALLLLTFPVCVVQAVRLHSFSCVIGAVFFFLSLVNWIFGYVYPANACIIIGFSTLEAPMIRRGGRAELLVLSGILLLALLFCK